MCGGSGSREEGFVYTCIFVYTAKDGGNCHQNHLFLRSSRQACISRGKYQMLENLGYVLESNWREEIASLIFKMVWLKSCHWCRETHLREKLNAIRSWKHHKNSKKTQKKKNPKKILLLSGIKIIRRSSAHNTETPNGWSQIQRTSPHVHRQPYTTHTYI